MQNKLIKAEMVFFRFQEASLLHAYSCLEIPGVCCKIQILLFYHRQCKGKVGQTWWMKTIPHLVSCSQAKCVRGKQHFLSKTRTIPLVFSPPAFRNPACLCPLPLLLSAWKACRPNTWLGLLLWIRAVPSSTC